MEMFITVITVPAFLICLLYLVFQSALKGRPPLLTLLAIVFVVGITALGAVLLGAVRSSYGGQAEWLREKQFFFRIFTDKLADSGDLKTAAEYMRTPEVKDRTLSCIRRIVRSFRPKMIFGLSTGGLILLLAAASLWIKRLAVKKYYPYLLLFLVLTGGLLVDTGVYYRQYASGTDRKLKNFLRCQQQYLMEELAGVKTALSIPEIIEITTREAGESGFSYGQRLPDLLREKKGARQSGEPDMRREKK